VLIKGSYKFPQLCWSLNLESGIVTLVPNGEEFPRMCWQEDRAMKEAWEGAGPSRTWM
jgi:hypothetical protein